MKAQERYMELVADYLAGTLTEQEKEELTTYMQQGLVSEEEIKGMQKIYSALGMLPVTEPSEKMCTAFYQSLEQQKRTQANGIAIKKFFQDFSRTWESSISFKQLAFGVLILLVGVLIGFGLNPAAKYEDRLGTLSSEVREMREMMMLTLLEQPSAIERLKAVNISQKMDEATQKVTNALLQTLNRDENVNVRLAALDALLRYANQPSVREGLVASIHRQDSPLVQMALAEAMVKLQEQSSVQPLEELLQRGDLNEDVEKTIKESIQTLI